MKVNMRSTVALTLAALAFGAVTANAHNTLDEVSEYHVTEVDTETVDCTDTSSLPDFSVNTFYSTHVHQSVKYTLSSGHTLALPTEVIGGLNGLTSLFHFYSHTEGQQITSATTSVEEQPTVSSAASTASTSTGEKPIISTVPSFTSTVVQPTFVSIPVASEPVPVVAPSSSAEAHSEASTEPVPVTTAEQPSATKEIIPPVVSTETPLANPLRPSVTPPSYTAIAQPPTTIVATGVPHPSNNTTVVATGIPRPNNTTTGQTLPPIHGAAPTLSATPGILLAFCGLICYLI
ncbi:hypothetical protein VE01_08522 [Pseudogymnoascus verrucosus]|uniref:Uncharacterized protein n=1 Tax=Pseudogymnoascus verrucosus TaxID=342668 RepID=A0A1B8GDA4_9PEZI|nr:uncharacterized protein VE01_08522 [Pseudogymnoascus verrucosus]OBT93814.2 hypothetical protein VE01_08522 [Pseudogymnoascus verrucosus]